MITNFKLFENHAYSKNKKKFFNGDVYIVFDDNEGRSRPTVRWNDIRWKEDKEEILNMLREYFEIDKDFENRALTDNAWAWRVWFFNSFDSPGIDLNVVTTPDWHIDENYNQITAKELIEIGLENLEAYFTANKYNL